jgi:hypothetical protein
VGHNINLYAVVVSNSAPKSFWKLLRNSYGSLKAVFIVLGPRPPPPSHISGPIKFDNASVRNRLIRIEIPEFSLKGEEAIIGLLSLLLSIVKSMNQED